MNARQRAQLFERILDGHAAWERRTLADLRVLGFKFRSVDEAFRYRQAQRTLARMQHDDLVELVAQRDAVTPAPQKQLTKTYRFTPDQLRIAAEWATRNTTNLRSSK